MTLVSEVVKTIRATTTTKNEKNENKKKYINTFPRPISSLIYTDAAIPVVSSSCGVSSWLKTQQLHSVDLPCASPAKGLLELNKGNRDRNERKS